ncbi:alpha-2-HS-glycoprotein 1 isoform X2 [Xiphias gladius]|uniref:alpha-2-HS-glycoprotein 1 isoform X2 n=1 Tax=Xiphias gladius TaxID=8245 RepID=UPI001A98E1EA|nr:alpha-2-HS-glycoprotein 1 isoform X2 [Xiphias gladius]
MVLLHGCTVCLLCIMKRLHVLALLSSAALLCSAAPALEPVTCSEDGGVAAARLAMHHINKHHHHGYKFQLSEILGNKVEKVDEDCNVELHLDLLETVCHTVNPKHFEDCEVRGEADGVVMANCTVTMAVKTGVAKVTKYECDTQQVKNNSATVTICPNCPMLMPLNSPAGLNSVHEAVNKFNQNTTIHHYYILQEVGRIKSGDIMKAGMRYYAEFALVETHCPVGSKIILEACKPLCPDTAHHAFCRSSYLSTNGLGSVQCEFYPPSTDAHGPGDQEPICRHSHPVHPPHVHGQGPPPHAHDHGHPPHAGGVLPPPHAHGQGPPPHAGDGVAPPPAHGLGLPPHAGGVLPPPPAHGQGPPSHAGCGVPPPHAHDHGHPPHAHDHGHPPHAGGGVPPPHAHGQEPPHGHGRVHLLRPCHGLLKNIDPALHPICPWPPPEYHLDPKLSQS